MGLPHTFAQKTSPVNAKTLDENFSALHNLPFVNVQSAAYGAIGDGIADDTIAIQAAIAASGGRTIFFPKGTYLITSSLSAGANGTHWLGEDAQTTIIKTTLNIRIVSDSSGVVNNIFENIQFQNVYPVASVSGPTITGNTTSGSATITNVSSTAGLYKAMSITGSGIPAGSYIRTIGIGAANNITIGNSVGAPVNASATASGVSLATSTRRGQTQYHVYLKNAIHVLIENCMFTTAFVDSDYDSLNAAGVWFDRDSLAQSFMHTVDNSWFHHAQILMGCSDSNIKNTHVWANPFDFCVKLCAPGNCVAGCNVSGSQSHGAIWITATATEPDGKSNHNIIGNNIDSGDIWYAGYGIYADLPVSLTVTGNRINNNRKAGVYLNTPSFIAITGNHFLNNNMDDGAFSDIEVVSTSFQGSSVVIVGNTFAQTASKTFPGYVIRDVNNGGGNPVSCVYDANAISANYLSPPILVLDGVNQRVIGNMNMPDSGIRFPASQIASSDPNTLDDYEELAWTPVDLSGASLTFTAVDCKYTKVGNVVHLWGEFTFPSTVSSAGVTIGGLPFVPTTGTKASLNVNSDFAAAQSAPLSPGNAFFFLFNRPVTTQATNANCSLKQISLSGSYRV